MITALEKRSFLLLTFILFLLTTCTDDSPEKQEDENLNGILNNKNLGEAARDLLSSERYKYLEVEICYVTDYAPTHVSLNNLLTFLKQRLNKPSGISFKFTAINSPGKASYSETDIALLEKANRSVYTRKDTLGVYFFFADAGYHKNTDNSTVLGIAYKNTSMALFQQTIYDLSGGLGQPERSKLETVVLQHEFGHILGLVNVGTNMQNPHQDESHGKHCQNSKCLMHYTVDTGNVIANLLGGSPPQLDADCLADLQANGGQ